MSRALLLVGALLLAGCLQPGLPITKLADTLPAAPGSYSFRAPEAYDATGARLAAHPLLDPARTIVGIESLVPGQGAEPNIGITAKGTVLVTSFDQVYRSLDKGLTWELAVDLVGPLHPTMPDYFSTGDPMLWVDTDTGRVFVPHMNPSLSCNYLQFSDREGEPGSWTDRPYACTIPGLDHQKIITAKPGPKGAPLPMPLYPNVVYICNNKRVAVMDALPGMGTSCSMSYDGGLTWPVETEAYVNDQLCSNINGHPAAWPDGTVGMVLGNLGGDKCKRPLTVTLSEDSGFTWQLRQCDETRNQVEIDADIAVTPDGTAYLLYRDTDELVYLMRSTDKFLTCDVFKISPPDHTVGRFTGITSGSDGRIAMGYLATRDPQAPGVSSSNVTPGTIWHAFVTTSIDANQPNPTFVTTQVTPDEDPVQVGCVWDGGGAGGPFACRNLLDFVDMHRDAEGRWYFAITDGCTPRNGCAGVAVESDYQSRDRQIGVLVQDRGESLLAEKGVLPSVGLMWPAFEPR